MQLYESHQELEDSALGKKTEYLSNYSPELLQAVPRSLNRDTLSSSDGVPFKGLDIWHAYELSWLNHRGKPVVALGRFAFEASSKNIIESKSFKLYLNSFNQTRFASHDLVKAALQRDLSKRCGSQVQVTLFPPQDNAAFLTTELPGVCIDELDIEVNEYRLSADLLKVEPQTDIVHETLHSHLLKSNCLITDQPDWASVVFEYQGPKISREALLRYLISFRSHNEFHEHCVERIFTDIISHCGAHELSVQALYTRRGGLDINPYRTTKASVVSPLRRINRQ